VLLSAPDQEQAGALLQGAIMTITRETKPPLLGELIADAFDSASRYSADPSEVARLATAAVERLFRGSSGQGRVRRHIDLQVAP
jgi:hypothetical protein